MNQFLIVKTKEFMLYMMKVLTYDRPPTQLQGYFVYVLHLHVKSLEQHFWVFVNSWLENSPFNANPKELEIVVKFEKNNRVHTLNCTAKSIP